MTDLDLDALEAVVLAVPQPPDPNTATLGDYQNFMDLRTAAWDALHNHAPELIRLARLGQENQK